MSHILPPEAAFAKYTHLPSLTPPGDNRLTGKMHDYYQGLICGESPSQVFAAAWCGLERSIVASASGKREKAKRLADAASTRLAEAYKRQVDAAEPVRPDERDALRLAAAGNDAVELSKLQTLLAYIPYFTNGNVLHFFGLTPQLQEELYRRARDQMLSPVWQKRHSVDDFMPYAAREDVGPAVRSLEQAKQGLREKLQPRLSVCALAQLINNPYNSAFQGESFFAAPASLRESSSCLDEPNTHFQLNVFYEDGTRRAVRTGWGGGDFIEPDPQIAGLRLDELGYAADALVTHLATDGVPGRDVVLREAAAQAMKIVEQAPRLPYPGNC